MSRLRVVWVMGVLGVLTGTSLSICSAQPPEPPREERVREAMRRSLEDAKRFQEQIEAAIKAVEEGARPMDAAEKMDPMARRFMLGDGFRRLGGEDGAGRPGLDRLRERREGMQRDGDGGERGLERGPDRGLDGGAIAGPLTGGPRGPKLMSPADAERTLESLRKEMPEVADALDELRRESPRMADGMVRRLAPRYRDALEIREREPELFRLRLEEIRAGVGVLRAVRGYRAAQELAETDGTKTQRVQDTTTALRSAVSAALEQKLAIQDYETKRLERRLEQLKRELTQRRERKDEAVGKMVERVQDGEMPGVLFGEAGPRGPEGAGGPGGARPPR